VAENKTIIPCVEAIPEYVGRKLGPSDWVPVSQERIDAFANATDDRQWIHIDPERASRESRWKSTIAHGYLTLALTPHLLGHIFGVAGCSSAVNTGLEKLRLATPVPAGSRVRIRAEIRDARKMPQGRMRVTFGIRIEVEGNAKPALLARINYVYSP
jgi:acyl dehydratase